MLSRRSEITAAELQRFLAVIARPEAIVRLLLVEDSERLRELLGETLRSAGYGLDVAGSVAQAIECAACVVYDLVIVDLGLPDGDGIEAIQSLRRGGFTRPILIITARGSVDDRITGLDSGADDYLIKPFNHNELLARARALLRRPGELAGPVIRVGPLAIDEAAAEARLGDQILNLRFSERRLLLLLMRRAGTVVSKVSIETALSEHGRELTMNAVEALVSRTRKVLADAGLDVVIETVRGVGYVLKSSTR